MFKVNNKNIIGKCGICSKLTIIISEWCHWRHSSVFIINFEHISHRFLVFLLLTLNKQMLAGRFVEFELIKFFLSFSFFFFFFFFFDSDIFFWIQKFFSRFWKFFLHYESFYSLFKVFSRWWLSATIHREKLCFTKVLSNSVQGITTWLLLIFFICLHNQVSSVHSIITYC